MWYLTTGAADVRERETCLGGHLGEERRGRGRRLGGTEHDPPGEQGCDDHRSGGSEPPYRETG